MKPNSLLCLLLLIGVAHAGEWTPISDGVLAKITADGKKIGWPGATGGIAVDRASGDVYMVVCDNGLWRSTDKGANFERIDGGKIGGRCETGFALEADPAGKRLMCFMIYGASALLTESGKTFTPSKITHLDFGTVDWSEAEAKTMIAFKHEAGGEVFVTKDAGATWTSVGKGFKTIGLFDANSLVASKGEGILRSTDGGATWTKVSDVTPTGLALRVMNGTGHWLSAQGVLVSKDKGATWSVSGTAVKAFNGPFFGKDANHWLVATKEGIQESTDAGTTWKTIAPLPTGYPAGIVGPNFGYDPTANILYASCMGKPAYKFAR